VKSHIVFVSVGWLHISRKYAHTRTHAVL